MKNPVIIFIKFYQAFKDFLNRLLITVFGFAFVCKHSPSCSQYALAQIEERGVVRGLYSGLKRVLSCW